MGQVAPSREADLHTMRSGQPGGRAGTNGIEIVQAKVCLQDCTRLFILEQS